MKLKFQIAIAGGVDQDHEEVEDPTEDVNGEDEHEPDAAVNGGNTKNIKILSKDSSKTSENVDDDEEQNPKSEEEKMVINGDNGEQTLDKSTSNDENKTDSENLITSAPNENGGAAVKNSEEEKQTTGENPQGFQVDIEPVVVLPIGKDIAEPPEKLKPAHIWSKEDLKEQKLHLNPRYLYMSSFYRAVFCFYLPR